VPTSCFIGAWFGHQKGYGEVSVKVYMRSRSSLGRDNRSENEGSNEAGCGAAEGLLVDGARGRTGRLGDFGRASSIMVSSEEPLEPVEDRDCDRGVEVHEAMSSGLGRWWWWPGRNAMGRALHKRGLREVGCGVLEA
jgi:hypothetical protein